MSKLESSSFKFRILRIQTFSVDIWEIERIYSLLVGRLASLRVQRRRSLRVLPIRHSIPGKRRQARGCTPYRCLRAFKGLMGCHCRMNFPDRSDSTMQEEIRREVVVSVVHRTLCLYSTHMPQHETVFASVAVKAVQCCDSFRPSLHSPPFNRAPDCGRYLPYRVNQACDSTVSQR